MFYFNLTFSLSLIWCSFWNFLGPIELLVGGQESRVSFENGYGVYSYRKIIFITKLSLTPNPTKFGAELVIFPNNTATHPPNRNTRKVVSKPRMTLTSKTKLLVSMVRP